MWKFKHVILKDDSSSGMDQISIRNFKYRKDLWEDHKSIKERLGIIFQNGILEDVDWEEWVWLVAFVRIYMSSTR